MVDGGQFMYVKRAALALCCTEKHIYQLIKDGKIEAIRLGKRGLRVSRNSVDEFIRKNRVDPMDYYTNS
jgi:excisionase family DNA binding protein